MEEYVGLDASKEATSFCVVDDAGKILAEGKVRSDPESLFEVLRAHTLCPERIVLEPGTWSGWLARGLRGHGLAVDMIDARQRPTNPDKRAEIAAVCMLRINFSFPMVLDNTKN